MKFFILTVKRGAMKPRNVNITVQTVRASGVKRQLSLFQKKIYIARKREYIYLKFPLIINKLKIGKRTCIES